MLNKFESKLNEDKQLTRDALIACGDEFVNDGILAENTLLEDFKQTHPEKDVDIIEMADLLQMINS